MLRNRLLAPAIAVALSVATPAPLALETPINATPIVSVQKRPRPRIICRKYHHKKVCHSRKWWVLASSYAKALHAAQQRAAFAAWITAISFPPADLVPVMNCIKDHESGNYSESSHPSSGSGAYQFTPGTWLTWFLKWRDSLPADHQYKYAYYALAFLAPAEVQDHVVVYALQNGGAHNWDPSYGDDPCTVGMS